MLSLIENNKNRVNKFLLTKSAQTAVSAVDVNRRASLTFEVSHLYKKGKKAMKHLETNDDVLNQLLDIGEKLSDKLQKLLTDHKMKSQNKWLDSQDVCVMLNISPSSLNYLCSRGYIAYFKLGTKRCYRKSDIQEFIIKQKKNKR